MRTRLADGVTRPLQLSWNIDTSLLEFIRLAGAVDQTTQTTMTAAAARWLRFDPVAVSLNLGVGRTLSRYTDSTDKKKALLRYFAVEVSGTV